MNGFLKFFFAFISEMLKGYDDVWARLGKENAPRNAAKKMTSLLTGHV